MLTKPIEYNIPITPDTAVKMALNLSTKTIYYVDDNGIIQIVGSVASNNGVFNNVTITGGTIQGVALTLDSLDNTPIGSNTPSTGRFTTLTTTGLASFNSMSTANVTITGGTIQGVALTLDSLDNTPIGATTPSTGKFTTLGATGVITSTLANGTAPFSVLSSTVVPNLNVSQLLGNTWAVPGTIGSTTPNSGAFTTLSASSTVSGAGFSTYLASPPAIGSTAANTGAFTTLSASSTVSGAGFSTYLASPPAIGGTAANTINGTTITASVQFSGPHNGTVGAATPNTGAFTTLSASSTVSGAGFSTYLASPPAIGGTAANTGAFTTLSASSTVSGAGFSNYLASPPAIGSTAASTGAFTTLSASSTVSGAGFSTYLASPPAIGSTTPNTGAFTTVTASSTVSGAGFSTYLASPPAIGSTTPNTGAFTTVTASSTITDLVGNVRAVPIENKTSGYTLLATDIGQCVSITTGGVTVPSGVMAIGSAVTIYNNSGSSQTITQGASTTMTLAGTSNTGNRTLALNGLATIICVASNTFVITGLGVS